MFYGASKNSECAEPPLKPRLLGYAVNFREFRILLQAKAVQLFGTTKTFCASGNGGFDEELYCPKPEVAKCSGALALPFFGEDCWSRIDLEYFASPAQNISERQAFAGILLDSAENIWYNVPEINILKSNDVQGVHLWKSGKS